MFYSSFCICQFLCDLLHFIFLMGMLKQYKRPSRTRWVKHQETALRASNKNLPIFIGFCNHHIQSLHNNSIVQIVPKLEGYLSNVAKTELVIFDSAKQDLLSILCPLTKVLQDCSLIVPTLITTCSSTHRAIHRLKTLLEPEGEDAFRRLELFSVCSSLLNNDLSEKLEDIIPKRAIRLRARENPTNDHILYHEYLLHSKMDDSLALLKDIILILDNLIQRFDHQHESLIKAPVMKLWQYSLILKVIPSQVWQKSKIALKIYVINFWLSYVLMAATLTSVIESSGQCLNMST